MAKCCNSPTPPPHLQNPTHASETCPFIQIGINCDPPQEFDAKGESMLTTRLHDLLSVQ